MKNFFRNIYSHLPLILGIIAFLLIVFSFAAPWILTSPCSNEKLDFTSTGQIGDTIGGLMNPFIALAGVLMTFIAFYIQKKANDQLTAKTESKETKETDDHYMLIKADLEFASSDIDERVSSFREIIGKIDDDPYKSLILKRTSPSMYKRMAEESRSALMSTLSARNVESPSRFVYRYFAMADFMYAACKEIYDKADENGKDFFDARKKVESDIVEIKKLEAKNKWSSGIFPSECFKVYNSLCAEYAKEKSGIHPIIMYLEKLNSEAIEMSRDELYSGSRNDLMKVSELCRDAIDGDTAVSGFAFQYKQHLLLSIDSLSMEKDEVSSMLDIL